MATQDTAGQFDEQVLARYLAAHVDGFTKLLHVQKFSGGQSNPTFCLETPVSRYVLRKKPPGELLPSAHQIEREYRVMKALEHTDVPVPRMLHLCEDSSVIGTAFYLMEHLDGRILRDAAVPGVAPAQRGALYDAMNQALANLHLVDWQAAGLTDFGKPTDYVKRQVARWSRQYAASQTDSIPAMDRLMQWLPTQTPPEATDGTDTTIVHGDFRIENMVFHPTEPKVIAVLDWELATLGHPLSDLAYNCMNHHLPSAFTALGGIGDLDLVGLGIPSESDYVRQYAQRTGRETERNWTFFVAFSLFRCAAILQGVYKRAIEGQGSAANGLEVGRLARPVADAAWRIASA